MLNVQTQLSHSKDGSVEITPQIVCKIACWNHILYIYFTVPGARGTATNLTPEPRRPMGLAIPIAKTGGFLFGLKLMDKFQKGTSAHLTDCFWYHTLCWRNSQGKSAERVERTHRGAWILSLQLWSTMRSNWKRVILLNMHVGSLHLAFLSKHVEWSKDSKHEITVMPSNNLSIRSWHVFTKTCFEIPRGLTLPDATNTQHNHPPPVRNKNAYLYHCITVMILMDLMDFFKLFISHQEKQCISNFLVQQKMHAFPPKKNNNKKLFQIH